MKKLTKFKSKTIMFVLALIFPLSATGMVYSLSNFQNANADSASSTYSTGKIQSVSMTNNNFNSSSSTYSLSTSLSGWNAIVGNNQTTAGIINTGNTFQTYMADTYKLSNNPLAKGADKYILMINSKTSNSGEKTTARQGYKSNSLTLQANSYYSFQASFKNDTNYNSYTAYDVKKGEINETTGHFDLDASTFNPSDKGFDSFISFRYGSQRNIYLEKKLTLNESLKISTTIEDVELFYEDANYVGFIHENKPIYISKEYVTETTPEGQTNKTYRIAPADGDIDTFTCSITYNKDTKKYEVANGTPFFTTRTAYTSLNDYTFGSMYLDGLKDENGKPVKAEFVKVSSKEWVTFYFFVATGNESQTVNLQLWLGTNTIGSSGVAFFDDCHVYQYSENEFWKTYQNYYGRNYTQETESGNVNIQKCTQLLDLRQDTSLDLTRKYNFDFEDDIKQTNLNKWTARGNGHAQVFDARNAQFFKSRTTYDFPGSTLSCEVTLDGDKVDIINENKNVLALWTKDNTVRVTSENIDINANEIYKIKAYYKVSELTSGNAYLFVSENDSFIRENGYNLSEKQYTLASEVTSSAISANGDNEFMNGYASVEFFVKGGAHFNSSVNLSLGLGKSDETSTGCILFDNISISKATTEEFNNATNKLELDTKTGTQTIANGNFRNVTISKDDTYPYAAQNWTITNEKDAWLFGGVINTDPLQYDHFYKLYQDMAKTVPDSENPYVWASYPNPKPNDQNNVMMLANLHKTWQKLKSDNFTLQAGKTCRLRFDYKTYNSSSEKAQIKVNLYDSNGFKLFSSQNLSTNNSWSSDPYELFIKTSNDGPSKVYIEIELGNSDEKVKGFAFFDNFTLSEDVTIPGNSGSEVVDMTNFFLNLPTNEIVDDLAKISESKTPAYTGTKSNENATMEGGIVKSIAFDEHSNFFIEGETDKNVFFLQSQGQGTYEIKSNFKVELTAETYYAISFKLKTKFNDKNLDKEKTYTYGASFGLSGFTSMTELKSSESYETYTLYLKTGSEAVSSNLTFSLICDEDISGSMAIYDLTFEPAPTEEEFDAIKKTTEAAEYKINEDRVYIATAESTPDENPDDDNKDDSTNPAAPGFDWLLIPTLITALAIVIAIVGYFMRKVKIKKIEIKRKESYDRKSSLNVDAIKKKAAEERDAELKEVKDTISKFQKELDNLETAHKQKVITLREKDKDKVSKETDKEFKQFAQKRTVIAEKIESLNKQLEEINSPEHLLALERKIFAKDEMKQKELAKESKKINDQQIKQDKTTSDKNKANKK